MEDVTPATLSRALRQHGLGELIGYRQIERGTWRQNVAVEASGGRYVFRCRPLFEHQFQIEAEAAEFLCANGFVSVPFPYRVDTSRQVWPWEYAVLPLLEGEPIEGGVLERDGEVARSAGELLGRLHSLPVGPPHLESYPLLAGRRHVRSGSLEQTLTTLGRCRAKGYVSAREAGRLRGTVTALHARLPPDRSRCFVHGDYSLNNLLLSSAVPGRISGVLDFSSAHFGHPAEDLPRQLCLSLDLDPSGELSGAFLEGYRAGATDPAGDLLALPLFLLGERLELWEYIRNERVAWVDQAARFGDWAGRYLELAGP